MDGLSDRAKRIAKREFIFAVICVTLLTALAIFNLNYKVYKVSGRSMNPILEHDDMGIAKKRPKQLKQHDMVIFDNGLEKAIKTVAAVEGDKVIYKSGIMYVNGVEQVGLSNPETDHLLNGVEFQLMPDEYWVIGYNLEMNMSYDSRTHGVVKYDDIIAKVIYPKKEIEIRDEMDYRRGRYYSLENEDKQEEEVQKTGEKEMKSDEKVLENE